MSFTVSRPRRSEPAISIRSMPPCARSTSTICPAIARATCRGVRVRPARHAAIPLRMLSRVFSRTPATPMIRPTPARLLELLDRADPQLLVQGARGLGPEAAHLEEDGERRRQVAAQRLHVAHRARGEVFLDPRGQLLADAREGLEPSPRGDGGDVLGQRLQGLGGALVGADAESALLAGLEQRGDLVENPRDIEVFHVLMVHSPRCDRRMVLGSGGALPPPQPPQPWRRPPGPQAGPRRICARLARVHRDHRSAGAVGRHDPLQMAGPAHLGGDDAVPRRSRWGGSTSGTGAGSSR